MTETHPLPSEESRTDRKSRRPYWQFLFLGIFWGLTSLAIVFTPEPVRANSEYPVVGFLLGSIFGHTTGICIWASLGQGSHLLRGILAVFYLFGLWLAVMVFFAKQSFARIEFALSLGSAILLQALLIFGFGWLARVFNGLSLVSRDALANMPIRFQFKIKHIMILTVAIACLMAVSRGLILTLVKSEVDYEDIIVFLFLGMAAVLITIPIAFACLLPRYFGIGLIVALLGCAAITVIEHSVFIALIDYNGPDFYHMLFINLFSAIFVFIFSMVLRWFGYRISFGKG